MQVLPFPSTQQETAFITLPEWLRPLSVTARRKSRSGWP